MPKTHNETTVLQAIIHHARNGELGLCANALADWAELKLAATAAPAPAKVASPGPAVKAPDVTAK